MIVRNAARLLLIFGMVFFTAAGCAETTVDKEGRFSANFPGPTENGIADLFRPDNPDEYHLFLNVSYFTMNEQSSPKNSTSVYEVSYEDYRAEDITAKGAAGLYKQAIKNCSNPFNIRLGLKKHMRSETLCKLRDIEGRDVVFDISEKEKSVDRMRFFLVANRLYKVSYSGPRGTENSKAATDFLDSFSVLP